MPEDQNKTMAEILVKLTEHGRILKKLEKYVFWQQVWGWVKMVLIVAPLVVSLYLLPPLLKQFTDQLAPLLSPQTAGENGAVSPNAVMPKGVIPLDVIKQYQELLKTQK